MQKNNWIDKEFKKITNEKGVQRFIDKIKNMEVIVMNKDKNWLKNEVEKIWHSGHPRLGEVVEYEGLKNLIEQLDEPMKIPELPKFVDEKISDSIFSDMSEIEIVKNIKTNGDFLIWFYKKYPDASNREMERYLLNAVLIDYTVEKEQKYRVRLGKGYFGGFNELKVTLILNDQPGSMDHVIIYYDKKDALKIAEQIGGKVEDVTE